MESKSIYYEGYSLSPLDVFEWIKNGAFEYIKAKNELGGTHQLKNYGATNTPFAQEYIVAHEFGHHIQKLQNTLGMSNYNIEDRKSVV